MDYQGQALAEKLYQRIIIGFCIFGWILGSLFGSYNYALSSWLIGTIIALVVCIPSWPCFRRHPLRFVSHKKTMALVTTQSTNQESTESPNSSSS